MMEILILILMALALFSGFFIKHFFLNKDHKKLILTYAGLEKAYIEKGRDLFELELRNSTLESQNYDLKEALAFYKDEENYHIAIVGDKEHVDNVQLSLGPACLDKGEKAREVIL